MMYIATFTANDTRTPELVIDAETGQFVVIGEEGKRKLDKAISRLRKLYPTVKYSLFELREVK